MKRFQVVGILIWTSLQVAVAQPKVATDPMLLTASDHPMQYYLSLPKGWTPGKKWPVLVSSESSEKEFKANAEQFMKARGELPFIIVVPFTVTTSGIGNRTALFNYTEETWKMIDRVGTCDFTVDGLNHVLADVSKKYGGESRFYITGLEAGTHLIWAMVFRYPEKVVAAAPVAGHYIARCLDESNYKTDPAHANVHIRQFVGDHDDDHWIHNPQWDRVKTTAQKYGYTDITSEMIPGKGHVKMADEVFGFFKTFTTKP